MDTAKIDSVRVSAFRVPTDGPESDGTAEWSSTTMVLVEILAASKVGLGYTYSDHSVGTLIESIMKPHLVGKSAFDVPAARTAIMLAIRNQGRPGIVAMALSAVDICLWDLKAKLLNVSLLDLLGSERDRAEVYGSGGFTSYSNEKLRQQLGGWAEQGFKAVKMKLGRHPEADVERVRESRKAIGDDVDLFIDANGAYSAKTALEKAQDFAQFGVKWFEEPVSSDDLQGLRFVRENLPTGIRVAAGEYGYTSDYFSRMLQAQAVDVLQGDATRCAGITGLIEAETLCRTAHLPFSFHCAPALHASVACALPSYWIGEYFFDHARIESMFFDGVPRLDNGALVPDRTRPGLGFEFKRQDADRFAI